jgi:hypothetical protein
VPPPSRNVHLSKQALRVSAACSSVHARQRDVVRVGVAERQPDLRVAPTQRVDRTLHGFALIGADAVIRFGQAASRAAAVAARCERAV